MQNFSIHKFLFQTTEYYFSNSSYRRMHQRGSLCFYRFSLLFLFGFIHLRLITANLYQTTSNPHWIFSTCLLCFCSGKLEDFDYHVLNKWYDWIMDNQKVNVDLIGESTKIWSMGPDFGWKSYSFLTKIVWYGGYRSSGQPPNSTHLQQQGVSCHVPWSAELFAEQ